MGKGDKRTKRGKIFKSSYGNTRPAGQQGHQNSGRIKAEEDRQKSLML